jgi:hypothetical protein
MQPPCCTSRLSSYTSFQADLLLEPRVSHFAWHQCHIPGTPSVPYPRYSSSAQNSTTVLVVLQTPPKACISLLAHLDSRDTQHSKQIFLNLVSSLTLGTSAIFQALLQYHIPGTLQALNTAPPSSWYCKHHQKYASHLLHTLTVKLHIIPSRSSS